MCNQPNCYYYQDKPEDLLHIFYRCPLAKETKRLLHCSGYISKMGSGLFSYWCSILLSKGKIEFWKKITICWKLWATRNNRIFCDTQTIAYALRLTSLSFAAIYLILCSPLSLAQLMRLLQLGFMPIICSTWTIMNGPESKICLYKWTRGN